ncbi:MAG TPA: response regulator [Actinomycetota bacterium]|nr:response regulator [Actinomycetota bacterium]
MRVLVIDDEPDVLLLCRVNLEFEGHEVVEATNGEDALRLALAKPPDAIVLDVMLPHRDGISVLRGLQHHPDTKEIPVVLLTAKAQQDDQVRGWLAGADEYVTKPFSPVALLEAVHRMMGRTPEERAARRAEQLHRLSMLSRL